PSTDIERALAGFGYIDRNHLRASALSARKNSPLTPEIQRFERFLDELEHSQETVSTFLNRLQPASLQSERDRQAWRVLSDELSAVATVHNRNYLFTDFRKLASEIAGLRTVDRLTESVTPGMPRVRIIHPHSLGSREHKWIFAPGFSDGEFPA